MPFSPPKTTPWLNTRKGIYGAIIGWIGVIYSTLGIVRPVCEYLKAHTPFRLLILTVMAGAIGSFLVTVVSQRRIRRISTGLMLTGLVVVYAVLLVILRVPEEQIHLLEYGLLALMVCHAVKMEGGGWLRYGAGMIFCALAGWGDEGIQYILPNRYFEWKDVGLNVLSSLLGGIWFYLLNKDESASKH